MHVVEGVGHEEVDAEERKVWKARIAIVTGRPGLKAKGAGRRQRDIAAEREQGSDPAATIASESGRSAEASSNATPIASRIARRSRPASAVAESTPALSRRNDGSVIAAASGISGGRPKKTQRQPS